jgi:hypothetical protein
MMTLDNLGLITWTQGMSPHWLQVLNSKNNPSQNVAPYWLLAAHWEKL